MGMKGAFLVGGMGWVIPLTLYSLLLDNGLNGRDESQPQRDIRLSLSSRLVSQVPAQGAGEWSHDRLKQIIHEACAEHDALVEGLEVMPDHVHLLLSVDPQFGVHRLVRLIKGRSSRCLRQEFPRLTTRLPTLWTNSYFVSTTRGAPLALVKRYIEGQKRGE
jgi:putative transposase